MAALMHLFAPMKILHVSDLHYNLSWFDWLIRAAPAYDLVCISGDLLDARRSDIREQILPVSAAIRSISTKVAICSGNHDSGAALWMRELREHEVWADGDRFRIGGRQFICHSWLSPLPAAGADDIWITHAPPAGTQTALSENDGWDRGDFEFGELCKAGQGPSIALCGHVHRPRSWYALIGWTLVLCPGESANLKVPAHIVIDLERRTATRHLPGLPSEAIRLQTSSPARAILRRRTPREIESLLDLTVSNQRAEGIHMTPAEIEETRRRLRRLAEHE